jgi:hypothetical protein
MNVSNNKSTIKTRQTVLKRLIDSFEEILKNEEIKY